MSTRYDRQIILPEIGTGGQEKLSKAKVLVVGAGGLGCPVLQYLTAAGVGTIGIVDGDTVDETNLQRQILYSTEDIGKPKAETAVEKLKRLNPEITLTSHFSLLTSKNVLELVRNYDIIVDCTDNFPTRYLLNDACVILGKPLVFGSLFKFEGSVSVFNYKDGPTYRCLYPNPPAQTDVPNCGEIGVLGSLTGIIGSIQANEVIKMITSAGQVLSGELLIFNSLENGFQKMKFSKDPKNSEITELIDYEAFCNPGTQVREITADELKEKISQGVDLQIIDVREEVEYNVKNIKGKLIPLAQIEDNIDKIETGEMVVIHCQSGARSKRAIEILQSKYGFKNLYNLKDGLQFWF